MSSLSAQLASINASAAGGKNVGSSLSTSKRHDDAVGRGLSHSTKHGHSIPSHSARHKPSVLYADSKAASDVPLTTLRENCVTSLRQLAKLTENEAFVSPQILQTLVGVHSLNFERGLATRTENAKMDSIIAELLSLLSTAMGESASTSTTSCFSSSLHVLEYLLRRYDIHERPETAERLILATLPHHEQPVFSRVLQLVDLASLPTWAFLRPYAAQGSPPPTRNVLAKRAAKDNALLKHCCDMAKTAGTIHESEVDGDLFQTVRRGVSRVISFAAAVIVEALNIQSTNPVNQGSIAEPALRCLLPHVLSACGDKKGGFSLGMICPDWRGFGYVLASCITEKCVLAADAREVLATTLAKGALETERAFESINLEDPEAPQTFELVADSLVTIMAVLSEAPKGETSSMLVMTPSKRSGDIEYFGYALPMPTYRVLAKLSSLPKALGHLYSDRDLVVAPFVASIVVLALSRLAKEANKKSSSSSAKLIIDLIEERLLKPIWKDKGLGLTSSVVAAVVESIAGLSEEQCTAAVLENGQSILTILRDTNATACDAGIARAVASICKENKQPLMRQRVMLILGISEDELKKTASDLTDTDMTDDSSALLLPPRVALEHADVNIRLNAIARLTEEPPAIDADGESLEQALLRHFVIEDELNVTVAAGKALVSLLQTKSFHITHKFAEDSLQALHKWALNDVSVELEADKSSTRKHGEEKGTNREDAQTGKSVGTAIMDDRVSALVLALEIAGNAVASISTTDADYDVNSFGRIHALLLQAMIANLDSGFSGQGPSVDSHQDEVIETSCRALFRALGHKYKGESPFQRASELLLTNEVLLDGFRKRITEPVKGQHRENDSLFGRYLNVYVNALTSAIDKTKAKTTKKNDKLCTRVSDALNACLFILTTLEGSANLGERETKLLVRCLKTCSQHLRAFDAGRLLNTVVELASVPSNKAYIDVCATSIARLCEEFSTVNEGSMLVILMEAASRPGVTHMAVSRLLSIASNRITREPKMSPASVADIIIFVLALLGHTEQSIRKGAIGLLCTMGRSVTGSQIEGQAGDAFIIQDCICRLASKASRTSSLSSSLLMDGASVLPSFIASSVLSSKDPRQSRVLLLKYCFLTACSISASSQAADVKKNFLCFGEGIGGCQAAALVLDALELSGEATFPLSDRYEYAGNDILNAILKGDACDHRHDVYTTVLDLIHSIARMMKGVTVIDATSLQSEFSSVVISTGPNARGTRARSYSIGTSTGVSLIDPYPKEMYDAILKCLSYKNEDLEDNHLLKRELTHAVVREVIGSQSWGEGVFKKMDKPSRRRLWSSLLSLHRAEIIEGAGEALLGLHVDATDIAHLMREEGIEKQDLSCVIFLTEYVHTHATRLRESSGYAELIALLFETLSALSSNQRIAEDDEDTEFARQAVLSSLLGLVQASDENGRDKRKKVPKKHLSDYASLLVTLVGGSEASSDHMRRLVFSRSMSLALSLLASLCSEDPPSVVALLVPAMISSSVIVESDNDRSRLTMLSQRVSREAFRVLVPVFFRYAGSAGLTPFDLFDSLFAESEKIDDEETRLELYSNMVGALMTIPDADVVDGRAPIGCLVVALLAYNVRKTIPIVTEKQLISPSTSLACDLLYMSPSTAQLASLIQLIGYANSFLRELPGGQAWDDQRSLSTDCNITEIEKCVFSGASSPDKSVLMSMSASVLAVISSAISSTTVTNFLRKCDAGDSRLSLRLWQDLLILQSTITDICGTSQEKSAEESTAASSEVDSHVEARFWEECRNYIDASLEAVQSSLPAHLFLASVASLIKDSSDADLCSRAVRFVSERAAETDYDSPEASLFLDMLPLLVSLLDTPSLTGDQVKVESKVLVQQASLASIEILARSLCLPSRRNISESIDSFTAALKHAAMLLEEHSSPLQQGVDVISLLEGPSCQVMCSAALCASTLVRLLGARSIPLLPELVGPLLTALSATNETLVESSSGLSTLHRSQANVLQVSILRAVSAIVEILPQFLGPYLSRLLEPSCLLSPALRTDAVDSQFAVEPVAAQLADTLSKKIPARQLIPSLCKSFSKCGHKEAKASLSMQTKSLQQSSQGDIAALRNWLFKALTVAYEFEIDNEGVTDLVDDANGLLLALVMKLSEAQLRPFYAKLREWKEDTDANASDFARKKLCFWSLSAVLSSELRSIFLPCLSTVVSDAVDDLGFAVSELCDTTTSKKLAGGKKKQRLETPEMVNMTALHFLKPLLRCLEAALHADAGEGGSWVRADDSQRFHLFLAHLSKLLESRVPSDFVFHSKSKELEISESGYHQLVHGKDGESGTLIGCLTALASAAGNEQLWKPLNHAVLQACGNESRAEVRKGGISCLLSLIKALGEEYMVLLPECLPVLSELLEDSDEEIAGLAQECVSIGEELLGESLQESLR